MQKTILVTGGAGYIGSACVLSLVKEGHKVTVLDDFSTGQRNKVTKEAEVIEGNIIDLEALDKVCRGRSFDTVMHFSAKKAVGESETNPTLYFKNNVTGSLNILETMEKYQIPQIIFSSTAAVYAPNDGSLVTEDSPIKPSSVYGLTKLMVEDMIKAYARIGKINEFSILRYFNVAGDVGLNFKEENAQNVFPILTTALQTGTPFNIFGTDYDTKDGTCVRDYIHLKDLIDGHLLALESKDSNTFNLGTGTGYTVRELIEMFELVGARKINVVESARRLGDVAVVTASAEKAKERLNWSPKYSLEDMVKSTLKA